MKTNERESNGKDMWHYAVVAKAGEPANEKGQLLDDVGNVVTMSVRKTDNAYVVPENMQDLQTLYPDWTDLWEDAKRGRDIRIRLEAMPDACRKAGTGITKEQKSQVRSFGKLPDAIQRATIDFAEHRISLEEWQTIIANNPARS